MINGIGIDVVKIVRMERWRKQPGLLRRFFHEDEISAALEKGSGADMSLAARFAAKEAFSKALGTGFTGIALKDIVVRNRENGRPELHVYGTALTALNRSGSGNIHLSLSHERDIAVAMVVLEGRQ